MYATLADLRSRYDEADLVQLTDQANLGVVDETRVASALKAAGVIIDGYVAVKYRTGAAPVPPLLTDLAMTLAWHRLHRNDVPETVETARKDAISSLEKISKGTIKLDAGEETLEARPGAVVVSRPTRIFGRDQMDGF